MLYLNTHIQQTDEEELTSVLNRIPLWRREKALRFAHRQGRVECALSYLELCRGLREEYGICEMPEFGYGEHGKPYLLHFPHIHFSLSHCRQAVGCLLSDTPCGLDIESERVCTPSLIRYTMNDDEVRQIEESSHPNKAFLQLWTRKEAFLKMRGTGLTDELRNILPAAKASFETFEQDGVVISTVQFIIHNS